MGTVLNGSTCSLWQQPSSNPPAAAHVPVMRQAGSSWEGIPPGLLNDINAVDNCLGCAAGWQEHEEQQPPLVDQAYVRQWIARCYGSASFRRPLAEQDMRALELRAGLKVDEEARMVVHSTGAWAAFREWFAKSVRTLQQVGRGTRGSAVPLLHAGVVCLALQRVGRQGWLQAACSCGVIAPDS